MAATLTLFTSGMLGGCALTDPQLWNPNSYRDERAVDIDKRLQETQPNVPNPF